MKTDKCNKYCEPEKGKHWLGDRFWYEDTVCCGCGAKAIAPHSGYSYPCSSSNNGMHYFTKDSAERNSKVR